MKRTLRVQFEQHVNDLQEETNELIANIVEVSDTATKTFHDSLPPKSISEPSSQLLPSYSTDEAVMYKDTITGQVSYITMDPTMHSTPSNLPNENSVMLE